MGVYVPQHLDRRLTLLGLPLEEFLTAVVPSMVGFISGHSITGLAVSFAGLFAIRFVKDMAVSGFYRGSAYKYLPTLNSKMVPGYWQRVGG